MKKLEEVLASLATSPVSKDREAIARIEKLTGEDISTIIRRLENESVLANVLQDRLSEDIRRRTKMLILSAGLMSAGISCMLTIWFRANSPYLPIAITPLAFITGVSAQTINLLRKP
ncbi:MAG: hypothetical protein RMY36_032470 [Nostoc sp. SerVER01]|nr:hypothetical protein [Nostoc sp. SerVER01]